MVLKDYKLTQDQFNQIITPLALDLKAYYSIMQEAVLKMIDIGVKKGWTPERLIQEITRMFDYGGNRFVKNGDTKLVQVNKFLSIDTVYKNRKLQGRMDFQGLPISIENRKGSVRQGIDDNGHEWKIKMHIPYGYIRLTEGVDGDHVDCYIGDNKESDKVFIVHQNNPDTGEYDEDKCMLGFGTATDAKKAYLKQYDRPGFFGKMDTIGMDDFKKLLESRKGKKLLVANKDMLSVELSPALIPETLRGMKRKLPKRRLS